MTRKAGNASVGSSQSMWVTLRAMRPPTTIRAGAVSGCRTAPPSTATPPPIMRTSGAQKSAPRNPAAVTRLASAGACAGGDAGGALDVGGDGRGAETRADARCRPSRREARAVPAAGGRSRKKPPCSPIATSVPTASKTAMKRKTSTAGSARGCERADDVELQERRRERRRRREEPLPVHETEPPRERGREPDAPEQRAAHPRASSATVDE